MKIYIFPFVLAALLVTREVRANRGAEKPWTTYEAEEMTTTGTILGPKYVPNIVETESSGQKCAKLRTGEFVEFTDRSFANAMVVRYSLPDSPDGGGIDLTLGLYRNGKLVQKLPVTSRLSWLYGRYPFSNQPGAGVPRNFYNEVHVKDLSIDIGDVLRLQKEPGDTAAYCIVDLIDLETVPSPIARPANSLALSDFGAYGKGEADDTTALRNCIAAAKTHGKIVWASAGTYKVTGRHSYPLRSNPSRCGHVAHNLRWRRRPLPQMQSGACDSMATGGTSVFPISLWLAA